MSVKELNAFIEEVVNVKAIVNFSDTRKFDVSISILVIDKAQSELVWTPVVALRAGLKNTVGHSLS